MIVPKAPSQQTPPPDSRDKTALGQMIAHSPTGLDPSRPSETVPVIQKSSAGEPGAAADSAKTRVGKVVGHVPTGISKGPAPASRKPAPAAASAARPRQASASAPANVRAPRSKLWLVVLIILVPMIFVSGAVFALGLVYFLKPNERQQLPEQNIVKLVQTPDPSPPVVAAPAPKEEKPVALKPAPEKKPDVVDLADVAKEKKAIETKPLIPPPAPPEEKRPPPPPAKVEEEKPAPKTDEKPVTKAEEKPVVKAPVTEEKKPDTKPSVAEKKQPEKEPPPATKVAEQPPKDKVPADIQALITKLRKSKRNDQRIAAAEALAERGEAAIAAARALCEAATSPDKDLSRSALQALEKVAPEIQESVFTLIVDGQAANHRKAIATLRQLEDKAKPAMPVILFDVRKRLVDLDAQDQRRQGSIGWGDQTLVDVVDDLLKCIPEIAPEQPDGLTAILFAGHIRFKNLRTNRLVQGTKRRLLTSTARPFRSTVIPLLGTVAEKQPDLRKVIVPQLSGFLGDSVQLLQQHSTDAQTKNNALVIDADLAEIKSISTALKGCGPSAKAIVAQQLIPVLKELEFSQNAEIRSTAKTLRKQMEAAPKDGDVPGFPKGGEPQSRKPTETRYVAIALPTMTDPAVTWRRDAIWACDRPGRHAAYVRPGRDGTR